MTGALSRRKRGALVAGLTVITALAAITPHIDAPFRRLVKYHGDSGAPITTSAIDVLTKSLLSQIQNRGSMWDMLQLLYQTVFMEVAMLPRMPLVSVDLQSGSIQPTAPISGAPSPTQPRRLPNYFAKPQMLFGLPPACNVIFPSQIKMYSYEENYATQPTRLYFNDEVIPSILKSADTGLGQAIQNTLTLAYPPAADAANAARRTNPKVNGKNVLIVPEELYKGPVMDRRSIPPWVPIWRISC